MRAVDEAAAEARVNGIEEGVGYAYGFLMGAAFAAQHAAPELAEAFKAAADELAAVTAQQVIDAVEAAT